MTTRTARTNDQALTAYMAQIDRLQAAVAILKAYAEDGVCNEAAPEDIHWGHVGTLRAMGTALEEVIQSYIA